MIPGEVADLAELLQTQFGGIDHDEAVKRASIIVDEMRRRGWDFVLGEDR